MSFPVYQLSMQLNRDQPTSSRWQAPRNICVVYFWWFFPFLFSISFSGSGLSSFRLCTFTITSDIRPTPRCSDGVLAPSTATV